MDFIFFIAALAKMTPKRIEVDTKNFTHVAKTISSLPKLLPHHAHALLTQQKPHKKNSSKRSYTWQLNLGKILSIFRIFVLTIGSDEKNISLCLL